MARRRRATSVMAHLTLCLVAILFVTACSNDGAAVMPTAPLPTLELDINNASPTVPGTSAATEAATSPETTSTTTAEATSATVPENTATAVAPTSTFTPVPLPSATPTEAQGIFIDTPLPGTLVGSPVVLTGRLLRPAIGDTLRYQVTDAAGQQLGSGTVNVGNSTSFVVQIEFNIPEAGGDIRAELFEQDASGTITSSGAIALFVESQTQQITIDTPPPGIAVGSPVVLTGRLARTPFGGRLNYQILASSQQQIGSGSFAVGGAAGRPTSWTGELTFNLPLDGDNITVQIFDRNPADNQIVASQSIGLVVNPTVQQIIVASPPPGVTIGSPMTVVGSTVRFPDSGVLNYRFLDPNGVQIGGGSFPVTGSTSSGSQFTAELRFSVPRDGGNIQLDIYDQDPANGAVVASTSLIFDVLPQYQAIIIDSPPPGTQVGSPVVLTGRTNLYPTNGQLTYRVLDIAGRQIGAGQFGTQGGPGQRGSFNASLNFTPPTSGGNITIELTDVASNGGTIASSSVVLFVAPPPTPTLTIDTPAPGTQVGSPVVITGHVTTLVPNGRINYRVRDAFGAQIGAGQFAATIEPGQTSDFAFTGSLVFTEPVQGGNITIELTTPSTVSGSSALTASITLYVAPQRQTRTP